MIYLAHRLLTPFSQIWKRGNWAWPGPTILAGDKERGPIWPDPAGWRNRTARPDVLCQHSRYTVEHSLKADRANADERKWQHVAAMLHSIGIRLTISWQCDMVVSPVVRHSAGQASRVAPERLVSIENRRCRSNVVSFTQNFRYKGSPPPTILHIRKLG